MKWPILCQLHNNTHLNIKSVEHAKKEDMVLTTMHVRLPNFEPIDVFPQTEIVLEITQWTQTEQEGTEQCATIAVQRYDDIVAVVKSESMTKLIALARTHGIKLQLLIEGGNMIAYSVLLRQDMAPEKEYFASDRALLVAFDTVVQKLHEQMNSGWFSWFS